MTISKSGVPARFKSMRLGGLPGQSRISSARPSGCLVTNGDVPFFALIMHALAGILFQMGPENADPTAARGPLSLRRGVG